MHSLTAIRNIVLPAVLCFVILPLFASAAIPDQERNALIDLYSNSGGTQWKTRSGWLGPAGTECAWYGVVCNEDKTSVVALNLGKNYLYGTITDTIGNLSNLRSLDLSGNYFQKIPEALGTLSSLQSLNISGNGLGSCYSSCIPTSLGNLANLRSLDLSSNHMYLYSFPAVLLGLTNLQVLNLSQNHLSDIIPDEIGNLAELQDLNLSQCSLKGTVPASLGNLVKLQNLDLSANPFAGPLPEMLGNLTELRSLTLSYFAMDSIPEWFGNLTNLETLYLDNTGLSSISAILGDLHNLRTLDLSYDKLSGSIPEFLGNLTQLESFNIGMNGFTGGIPEFFGSMTSLKFLNLSSNPLGGTIPDLLLNLGNLETLGLNDAKLGGSIPEFIENLINLGNLHLSGNALTGSIPASLGNLAHLTSLDLWDNQLSGYIPDTIGNLVNLKNLRLSYNKLSGPMPESLGNLAQLILLDASSNDLTGEIPSSFINLRGIYEINLRSNHLSGRIPTLALRSGGALDLGLNHLSGPLSPSLSNLHDLILDGNMLSGDVPDEYTTAVIYNLNASYNALNASYEQLVAQSHGHGLGFAYQTVAPKDAGVSELSSSSAKISWTPINYSSDSSRYEIYLSTVSSGPFTLAGSTISKTASSFSLSSLAPNTPYYLIIRTVTDPHANNPNTVMSDFSAPIAFATQSLSQITIATSPAGQSFTVDGTAYVATQTFSWEAGSSHTIWAASSEASAGTKYVFANWSDGGAQSHTITVPENATTYTAAFTKQYRLTTSVSPSNGGSIRVSPASADGYYPSGSAIQLTATADRGYLFYSWNGALTGTANPQTIVMSAPRTLTAAFWIPSGQPARRPAPYRPPPRTKPDRSTSRIVSD